MAFWWLRTNMRSAKWKKSQMLKFWRQPGRNIVKLLCHGVVITDFLRKAFLRNITEVLAAFMKPLNVKPCVQLWDFSQAMQVQRILKTNYNDFQLSMNPLLVLRSRNPLGLSDKSHVMLCLCRLDKSAEIKYQRFDNRAISNHPVELTVKYLLEGSFFVSRDS